MPILVEELIQRLPSDTEAKVKKAKEQFNVRVRDALRRETRLSFHRDDGTIVTVPIYVLPGLPEPLQPLENQSIEDKHRVALLLSPFRRALESVRDEGRFLDEQLLPVLAHDAVGKNLLNGGRGQFAAAAAYADFLLRVLSEFELTKFILRLNTDVLGVYRYKVRPSYDEPEPKIELYWGVIGLVAGDLAINVEDLTCVVLAHELAHAYTHVGGDADDHWWKSTNFLDTDHELKEGLAQFYALLVCQRIDERQGGSLRAFEKLLSQQPDAYHTHERWKESTPEHVRLAMLEARRHPGKVTAEQFEAYLHNARRQLRRVSRAAVEY